jgi:membrane-associated protein
MDLKQLLDVFLHVNKHLETITAQHPTAVYGLLFVIVFCETGLVVTPFLPGDSLLFAAGTLAARQSPLDPSRTMLDLLPLLVLLMVSAVLGDSVNYSIGTLLGPKLHAKGKLPFVKKEHLDKTRDFYERYGAKTLVIARFVPIVRTFAPFVAGVGSMKYARFMTYNVVGALSWVLVCVFAGYALGNIPIVQKRFELVILLIIFVSILPGIIGYLRERGKASAEPAKS